MKDQTRSSIAGHTATAGHPAPSAPMGGGSAGPAGPATPGGGYPDVCTSSGTAVSARGAAPDPRLDDLRRMGLSRPWLRVASAIGFDAFMAQWRALSGADGLDGRDRIVVPKLSTYHRYQRNQMIRTLAADGMDLPAIRDQIAQDVGETLSLSHIRRQIDAA